MAVEGTLELFKLPEILQLVAQQRKTGILTIQGQQDIIAISFLNGQIVAADALNQTVEEGLSHVLVGEGLMTSVEFQRAAAEFQNAGGRLLDHLVERRYVDRPALLRALRIQTTRLLEQLMVWDKGEFKFYSGDEVSYEEGFVPIPVDELLFQAAQRTADAARPAPARPVAVPAPAPARPAAPVPVSDGGLGPLPGPDELARRPPAAPTVPATPVAPPAPAPAAEDAGAARPGLRVVRREGVPPAPGRPGASPGEAETAGPFRKMKVEAPATDAAPRPFAPKLLAAGLALLAVASLLFWPESVLLPFPWQQGERDILVQDRRSSQYLKIDQAAKTRFLLEGSFPAQLAELAQSGLLSPADLRDPQGHPLRYEPGSESYTLQPLAGGQPVPGAETSEAITGNFLLDPEFLAVPADAVANPLVLLD